MRFYLNLGSSTPIIQFLNRFEWKVNTWCFSVDTFSGFKHPFTWGESVYIISFKHSIKQCYMKVFAPSFLDIALAI